LNIRPPQIQPKKKKIVPQEIAVQDRNFFFLGAQKKEIAVFLAVQESMILSQLTDTLEDNMTLSDYSRGEANA
jgi:hypothetical protein